MAGKLTARDRQLAALIASGLTYTEAGKRLKLSERTIQRAMQRPEVRDEVDAIRARAVEAGLGILCNDFAGAVTDLRKLRQKGAPKDAVKLGAVKETIDALLRVRGQVALERRIEALERVPDEFGGTGEGAGTEAGGPSGEPESGREPERAPGRPDGGTDARGDEPRPVATEADNGPLDAMPSAGESAVWQE
jgi:hypothetical protein